MQLVCDSIQPAEKPRKNNTPALLFFIADPSQSETDHSSEGGIFKEMGGFSHNYCNKLRTDHIAARRHRYHLIADGGGLVSRLGGKEKRGVFATRSPFRPNSIGLSCVKLEKVRIDQKLGPVLTVSGLDLLDHTPLFDIKPYLPYVDAHPEAENGFAEEFREFQIPVVFPEELQAQLPEHLRGPLLEVLAQDPRAAYNKKPDYIYGMAFDDYDIRFTVAEGILTVKEITRRTQEWEKVK